MTCFAFAYSDYKGVSVNLFETRAERDTAVLELLSDDYSEGDPAPFTPDSTAEDAWAAYCEAHTPDFHLAFNNI